MLSQEISKRWIEFFEKRGHTVVPSASLISNEPGAMFTIAERLLRSRVQQAFRSVFVP